MSTKCLLSFFFLFVVKYLSHIAWFFIVLNYVCWSLKFMRGDLLLWRPLPPLPQAVLRCWKSSMRSCLAFWKRLVIDIISYGLYPHIRPSHFYFLSSWPIFLFSGLKVDSVLSMIYFGCFQVADTKQKRKKGIFTKQGGDKEVLFRLKNVHFICTLLSTFICIYT